METKPLVVVLEPAEELRARLRDAITRRYADRFTVLARATPDELAAALPQGPVVPQIALMLVAHDPEVRCDAVIRSAGPLAPYAKRVGMVAPGDLDFATK